MNNKKINVQILRVLACMSVFVVHFGQRMSFSGSIRQVTDFGRYGVELFLILSGYLAFLSFNGNNLGGGYVFQYYKKRIIRLLPLYFIIILYYYITETFLWGNVPQDELGVGWVRYLFLLNGFIGSETYFWGNLGITWTIPIFAFFYLIFPIIYRIIKNIWQAIILFIIVYIVGIICNRYLQLGPNRTITYFNNLFYLKYLCLGIIAYFIEKNALEYVSVTIIAAICIVFSVFGRFEMLYSLIFSIILILTNKINFSKLPQRFCACINSIDDYSYTLYLGHGIVFCGIIDKFRFPPYLVCVIAIFGSIIITFVLKNYLEKPMQNLLRKVMF